VSAKRLKVLIADDESDIRTVVGLNLGLAGIDFGEASDGEETLARLRTERWDACLLDLMMPEIDGFDVLQALSEEHRTGDLALIVLSARNAPSAALRALELGAHAHLAKPFSPNAVAQTIEELAAMTADEREALRLTALRRATTLQRLGMPSV
jgi:CheY-like chemotaxis protein